MTIARTNEIANKVNELLELESLMADLKEEIEGIKDEIKAQMIEDDTEVLVAGTHTVRWTQVLSTRFDSTAFKKVMPEVYKAYTKQVASRKWTVA